jgi:hypothetical protein
MAIYHMSIKIGSRSKGQSAVAAAAYRSGEKLTDEETGLTSDYTRKEGVVFSEISLCENAPAEYANRETLWNAVHDVEKNKNAQLWREFEVALPKELNREEQIETVREYVNGLTKQGMCADWSVHDKGDGNPHAHIMATMRSITENGKWAAKSKLVYDLDEHGERIFQKVNKQGRKQYKNHKEDFNDWNKPERVEEWRASWAGCCNKRLELSLHIDHRSHQRRGLEEEPTIHEGYAARAIEQNGGTSDRCQTNREIEEHNRLLRALWLKLKEIEEKLKKKLLEELSVEPSVSQFESRSETESRIKSNTADEPQRAVEPSVSQFESRSETESRIKSNTADEPQRAIQNASECAKRGESVSAGKQRIANLLARRSRTVNNDDRGTTNGERTTERRNKTAAPSTPTSRTDEQSDTEAILRAADSVIKNTDINGKAVRTARTDTDTTLRKSETTVTSAEADRQERELAEQRRATEKCQRAKEASERARKTKRYRGR